MNITIDWDEMNNTGQDPIIEVKGKTLYASELKLPVIDLDSDKKYTAVFHVSELVERG